MVEGTQDRKICLICNGTGTVVKPSIGFFGENIKFGGSVKKIACPVCGGSGIK